MQLNRKPLAFVDESSICSPKSSFTAESIDTLKGVYLHTGFSFKFAISEIDRKQEEHRMLAPANTMV